MKVFKNLSLFSPGSKNFLKCIIFYRPHLMALHLKRFATKNFCYYNHVIHCRKEFWTKEIEFKGSIK